VRRRSGLGAAATVSFIASTTVFLVSAPARANGRYPAASQIIVDPTDPMHLVVAATFGFLESRDQGKSFNWLCEAAIGEAGTEGFDISIAVTGNGNTVLGLLNGMATTRDGCTFQLAPELGGQTIGDLTWSRSAPHQVVGYSLARIAGGYATQIVRSDDDGVSWTQVGPPLPASLTPLTIDVAPSDTKRIYFSGMADRTKNFISVLMRSDDGGATFQSIDIPGTEQQRMAFIAAVHPTQPDRVYLRVFDDREGILFTTIYMSADGGRTFEKIFAGTEQLFGFAISPDGTEMAFGGPADGLYVGAADGTNLSRRSDLQPTSLTWTPHGLYATTDSNLTGFSVGLSTDSGATFHGVFKYQSICGQTTCGSRATAVCRLQWDLVAPQLGVTCSAPDGGGADASADVNAGEGGVPDATIGPIGPSNDDDSDGCAVARGRPSTTTWTSFAGLGLALLCRRRRHA
jgi:hypothetical protein